MSPVDSDLAVEEPALAVRDLTAVLSSKANVPERECPFCGGDGRLRGRACVFCRGGGHINW